ncbi:hypothetical protein PRZ48_006718 [Zasmidium cellare]|uniref:Uncharacterized protein n=1 Tax=Zasmidium cellare TaxID=395010 RepID=A0ABR0EPV4_ZASCE|nr:hypothetical protein PRZ48_006718 [Zasmidium cellare]
MQRPQDRLYALANVVDWSEPMQPPKSNYRISLWELLSEFLEQPRHIDFKKMDHHYSTVLELLVIGLEITIREERIRQAIRQRAALYPSSSALVDSTELFYTGSNGRVGRSAVRIANSTEGKLYMAENDETAFESSLDQSTDEKNKDKAPRALWAMLAGGLKGADVARRGRREMDRRTSIIVEEYSPDVLFDLLDMEEDGNGSSLDLDVCFDEEDYLLWLVYTHSADMGVLNDEEIGEYLRYEVMRFDLSSFAVLTEESGTSDEK